MTLIAGFIKDDCPILTGDLLLSTTDDSTEEIVLPTIGKISKEYLSKAKHKPVGLCQKVNLLSPKLAIAWAGSMSLAKDFIQKVMKANLHINPSYPLLKETFNKIKDKNKIAIIGMYRDEKGIHTFDFNTHPVSSPDPGFKYFQAAGSGYQSLVDIVSAYKEAVTSGQPNKLDRVVSTGVEFDVALLSQEILTKIPLEKAYGAGYEIVHPLGNDLAKFSDFTYLFWKAEEGIKDHWRLQPFPFLAAHYSYHNDVLVIRTVRMSSNAISSSAKIDSDELHIIQPIYRSIRAEEFVGYEPASLNSKRICNVFLWKNHAGEMGAFATYGHYNTKLLPIIWTNEFKEHEGVDINMKFVQESISKVAAMASGSGVDQ